MHNNYSQIYYFIDSFNMDLLEKLNKNIAIIYRNYTKPHVEEEISKINKFCNKIGKRFYLSNDIKLVDKLNLKGIYIPSFNKTLDVLKLRKKKIHILGSAHNLKEILQKKKQKIDVIFISPIFKISKKNTNLSISKFKILANHTNQKVVALGGINIKNIKKIKMLDCYGYASISYINNTYSNYKT